MDLKLKNVILNSNNTDSTVIAAELEEEALKENVLKEKVLEENVFNRTSQTATIKIISPSNGFIYDDLYFDKENKINFIANVDILPPKGAIDVLVSYEISLQKNAMPAKSLAKKSYSIKVATFFGANYSNHKRLIKKLKDRKVELEELVPPAYAALVASMKAHSLKQEDVFAEKEKKNKDLPKIKKLEGELADLLKIMNDNLVIHIELQKELNAFSGPDGAIKSAELLLEEYLKTSAPGVLSRLKLVEELQTKKVELEKSLPSAYKAWMASIKARSLKQEDVFAEKKEKNKVLFKLTQLEGELKKLSEAELAAEKIYADLIINIPKTKEELKDAELLLKKDMITASKTTDDITVALDDAENGIYKLIIFYKMGGFNFYKSVDFSINKKQADLIIPKEGQSVQAEKITDEKQLSKLLSLSPPPAFRAYIFKNSSKKILFKFEKPVVQKEPSQGKTKEQIVKENFEIQPKELLLFRTESVPEKAVDVFTVSNLRKILNLDKGELSFEDSVEPNKEYFYLLSYVNVLPTILSFNFQSADFISKIGGVDVLDLLNIQSLIKKNINIDSALQVYSILSPIQKIKLLKDDRLHFLEKEIINFDDFIDKKNSKKFSNKMFIEPTFSLSGEELLSEIPTKYSSPSFLALSTQDQQFVAAILDKGKAGVVDYFKSPAFLTLPPDQQNGPVIVALLTEADKLGVIDPNAFGPGFAPAHSVGTKIELPFSQGDLSFDSSSDYQYIKLRVTSKKTGRKFDLNMKYTIRNHIQKIKFQEELKNKNAVQVTTSPPSRSNSGYDPPSRSNSGYEPPNQ